ncbi:MAG: O-acetyl-ADP-ribose deacetylase [Candidatus Marinimicrobia bacterium]|nr:O-acetyl-ADP-ribose deacetylase [Candidatus Neomarinimicrobiota bacterium]
MGQVEIYEGDITRLKVDAIVNAANSSLKGGGGVDGAIHRAAGPSLLKKCQEIRDTKFPKGLPTGEAVITKGYNLPARYVIHTVGPVWHGGDKNEDQLLADCYRNSLKIAQDKKFASIAFPAISTGVYHFPHERACKIAYQTVQDYIFNNNTINKIIFAVIGKNVNIYQKYFSAYFNNSEE